MRTIQLKVIGKVQGVGFRYYTNRKANEFNIKGFVQNKTDGSVYIEDEGEEIDMDTFIDWVHQGPSWSRVQKVIKSELPFKGFIDFQIR